MKWLGRIFGTQKAIDAVLDPEKGHISKLGGWIDRMQYTDQEKAADASKTQEWALKQMEALHPFKVTQRVLAMATMFLWLTVGINVLVSIWVQNAVVYEQMLAFAFSDYVFWPTMAIFGLYFAGGAIPSRNS